MLCGSGSGRIGIIVPDSHPADPDPFQPDVDLNYIFCPEQFTILSKILQNYDTKDADENVKQCRLALL